MSYLAGIVLHKIYWFITKDLFGKWALAIDIPVGLILLEPNAIRLESVRK